jgi:hypothetical protein
MHVICCSIGIHASAEFPNQGGRAPFRYGLTRRKALMWLAEFASLRWQSAGELFPTLLHGSSGYRFHLPAAGERTPLPFLVLRRDAATHLYDAPAGFGISM